MAVLKGKALDFPCEGSGKKLLLLRDGSPNATLHFKLDTWGVVCRYPPY